MSITRQLGSMKSGECRWLGRHDLHVYCWAPCDRLQDGDRVRWIRRQPSYRIAQSGEWLDAASAAATVEKLLSREGSA